MFRHAVCIAGPAAHASTKGDHRKNFQGFKGTGISVDLVTAC